MQNQVPPVQLIRLNQADLLNIMSSIFFQRIISKETTSEIPRFDLDIFIRHLEDCIKCPPHLQIYKLARKILQHRHQIEFAQRTPEIRTDVVNLRGLNTLLFPIELTGGFKKGLPIYVSKILGSTTVRKSSINRNRTGIQGK